MIRILCLHLAENQASYRYRVAQFLPYWKEYDIDMHPLRITSKSYRQKLSVALESKDYDYVWLQKKPLSPIFTSLIARHSHLIYDYDDALYAVESCREGKPKATQPGSKQTIRRLNAVLKRSSLIFAGSEALAEYSRKFNPANTFIVPTAYEKLASLSMPVHADGPITIGWIGNTGNLYFLNMIDRACAAIQQRHPLVRFSVMSGKPPEGLATCWKFTPWSKEAESSWLDSIDIGIMPLQDDEWSRGKCAFKLLQYMAHSNGREPERGHQWQKRLSGKQRTGMGANVRNAHFESQQAHRNGKGEPEPFPLDLRTAEGSRDDSHHPAQPLPASENPPFTLTQPTQPS